MNFKSEKGFTGIQAAITIVILFIFISIISILSYYYNSTAKEIELKSKATTIAINEIEGLKNKTVEDLEKQKEEIECEEEEIEGQEGFYKTIIIQDYHDIDSSKIEGIIVKVTVQIEYMFNAKKQTVELNTIISKEI
jgi:hypothetical protein